MPKLLLAKPVLPVAGEYLHSRASKLSSFMHRPQTGNWRRKLTASSGASGFAISARRLPLFRRLVNSRALNAGKPDPALAPRRKGAKAYKIVK